MGRLIQGSKPTRAERKAEKKAAKEAAKQVEFDIRDIAKEEKRAARASRSRWRRKRKDSKVDVDGFGQDIDRFGHNELSVNSSDEFLLEESMQENPANPQGAFDHQEAVRRPRQVRPLYGSPARQMSRESDDTLSRMRAVPDFEPEQKPERRSLGMRILKRRAVPESRIEPGDEPRISLSNQQGTRVMPSHKTTALTGAAHVASPADSFAALRRTVNDRDVARSHTGELAVRSNPDNVLVLDDPLVEPGGIDTEAVSGLSENWLGLWLSEDGAAIFIEEDEDGWFAVTVLPDPTSTCYAGPDYPEIQSYRMPASYAREELGEFDGERLSVITVPGLPDTHRSPMMYIYFLTSVSATQGGGSRFATLDDPTRRVFIAADFELGTVNPWSDRDDIEWIDPSINYYKAPGKLDAYMMRRMAKDDPLNQM